MTLKATMFDAHGTELSGERGTSTAFSGEGEKTSHVITDSPIQVERRSDLPTVPQICEQSVLIFKRSKIFWKRV